MHVTCPDCGSDSVLRGGGNGKLPEDDNPYGPRTKGEGNGTTIIHLHIPREDGQPPVIYPFRQKGDKVGGWAFHAARAVNATVCDDCGSEELVEHLGRDFMLEMAIRMCEKGPYTRNCFAFAAEALATPKNDLFAAEVTGVAKGPQEADFKTLLVFAKDKIVLAAADRNEHRKAIYKHLQEVEMATDDNKLRAAQNQGAIQ